MRQWMKLAVVCMCFVVSVPIASAADHAGKQPLNEVFNRIVIVPYDYEGKAFIHGQLTDMQGEYELVQRDGRVFVPIRLLSTLVTEADRDDVYWEARWQPEVPDEVRLVDHRSQTSVIFTVDSRTVLINGEPLTVDVAPQKINGRIMLPLRSAAEALDQHIDWLQGLIVIGDDYVDLQHPQTTALVDTVKKHLRDERERVDYEAVLTPVTQSGGTVYYLKHTPDATHAYQQLYARTEGKSSSVPLTGSPRMYYQEPVDDALYYVTMVDGEAELHAYSLADESSRRISSLGDWNPANGWLTRVEKLDGELYVTLHSGDMTMGSDTLYKVDNGMLQEISSAKSFIQVVKHDDMLYYTDFTFMNDLRNNLYRVDAATGQSTQIGVDGFAYGASRTVQDNGGISLSGDRALYVRDGYLYALGYNVGDMEDKSAVYKLNLADQTQVKLTPPADQFWIANGELYYRESDTGFLAVADLNGNLQHTLVERPVLGAKLVDSDLYYTSNASENAHQPGVLYRYDLAAGQDIRLSDHAASSYFVGESDVYYVSDSYAPGIYKIDKDGRHVHLISDYIDTAALSADGLVYTLKYKEGIYTVK